MKLKKLFKKYNDDEIITELNKIYKKIDEKGYRSAIKEIRTIKPEINENDLKINYEQIHDIDGETYYEVNGKKEGDKARYDLILLKWEEWLGMDIEDNILKSYDPLFILCEILNEMTFLGFSSEKIVAEREEMKKRVEEVDKLIASGDTSGFKTWDEVKKELFDD